MIRISEVDTKLVNNMKKKIKKPIIDYVKAVNRASREIAIGFGNPNLNRTIAHKSKKQYNRSKEKAGKFLSFDFKKIA